MRLCHGLILEIHSKLSCHRASLCIVGYVCALWRIYVGFFKAGGESLRYGVVSVHTNVWHFKRLWSNTVYCEASVYDTGWLEMWC